MNDAVNTPSAHWGYEVTWDMEATEAQEEQLVPELEVALREVFEAWKAKAEAAGVKIHNVEWD